MFFRNGQGEVITLNQRPRKVALLWILSTNEVILSHNGRQLSKKKIAWSGVSGNKIILSKPGEKANMAYTTGIMTQQTP